MKVDRKKELDKLLATFREGTNDSTTDIDLILEYLEEILQKPGAIGLYSKKINTFNVETDPNVMRMKYTLVWYTNSIEMFQRGYN